MKKLKIWASVSLTLGILGMVFFVIMTMALIDISHGETPATAEWLLVRLALGVVFFVIVATFVFSGIVLKHVRDQDERKGPKPLD